MTSDTPLNPVFSFGVRYAHLLNPYSKTLPAVIAKASAVYNPFIYAIVHAKYRYLHPHLTSLLLSLTWLVLILWASVHTQSG